MRRVSKRRASELKVYSIEGPKFLEEHPICQCCKMRASEQVHHKKGKEGKWLLDQEYWMAVCFACHAKIEVNRAWAYENKYLLRRSGIDQA